MGCHLRARGRNFNAEAFASRSSIPGIAVWNVGEPRRVKLKNSDPQREDSGVEIDLTRAEGFEAQLSKATQFAITNQKEIEQLVGWPGVEEVVFDFAVYVEPETAGSFFKMPSKQLIQLATLGCSVELSVYTL